MKKEMKSPKSTRRKLLAGIAAGAGGLVVGSSSAVADEWACTSSTSLCNGTTVDSGSHNLTVSDRYECQTQSIVQHLNSVYANGQWLHDYAISGAATVEDTGCCVGIPQIQGQRYKIQGPDGQILAYTNNNYHGLHPKNGHSGLVEDVAQPVLQAVVGSFSVGASWMFTVNSIFHDKIAPQEGFDFSVPDGFGFTDVYDYGEWNTVHYHRVRYESDLYEPTLSVRSDLSDYHSAGGSTLWSNLEMVINPADGSPLSVDQDNQTMTSEPSTMSSQARKSAGIRKVPSDSNRTVMHKGEEHKVEYVAERPPVRNVTKRNFRTKENSE